jgi:tripartite-type tricarboxylate transporter receptor subunit TctC
MKCLRLAARLLLSGLLGLFAMALGPWVAHAQSYPDRALRAVVPFPPGGGTDIFGRLIAQHLAKALAQPVVIENRAGANGNIGMELVARSAPDGYTLLMNSSAATVNPALHRKLRFDALADLIPVAVVCEYYNVIVINPQRNPVNTLAEFVAHIRRNPGKINAAAGGTSLPIDMFRIQNQFDFVTVPYKGASDAILALLQGDADFMIVNTPAIIGHMQAGKLRALAVTAPARQSDIPEVPTTREAGMPDYNYGSFFGVYVQAGTPPRLVERLNAAINQITRQPEVIEALARGGAQAVQMNSVDSIARYRDEIHRLRDLVSKAGIPYLD